MSRHLLCFVAATLLAGALPLSAAAQQYPNKPIRMINPNAAGGVTDRMSRMIAKALEPHLGQPVVVENKPGAASVAGVDFALKSAADGYTVGNTCPGVLIVSMTGTPVPFDFEKDAVVVGMMGALDVLITTRGDSTIRTIEQLVAAAKAKPKQLSIGMVQTPSNIIPVAYLAQRAGVELNIIGYKGEANALTDLLGGSIQFAINAPGTVLQHIQAGTVRPVLMLNKNRNPAMPDVPSLSDTKVEGFEPSNYCVMFMPRGTPADAVRKFNSALNEVGKDPGVRNAFTKEGLVPFIGGTPGEATVFFNDIAKRWRGVLKEVDYSKF